LSKVLEFPLLSEKDGAISFGGDDIIRALSFGGDDIIRALRKLYELHLEDKNQTNQMKATLCKLGEKEYC